MPVGARHGPVRLNGSASSPRTPNPTGPSTISWATHKSASNTTNPTMALIATLSWATVARLMRSTIPNTAMRRRTMSPPMARGCNAHETPTHATMSVSAKNASSIDATVRRRTVKHAKADDARRRTGTINKAASTKRGASTRRMTGSRVQSDPRPAMVNDRLDGPSTMATNKQR